VREAYLGFYVGECPHVPKILVMGQSNGSFWKKEKELWVHPSLINKSMNKYPQFGTNWHPLSRPIFLHNYLIDV
jgi:hypothetical protein